MQKRTVVLLIVVLSLVSSCAEQSYPVSSTDMSEMPGSNRAFKQFVAEGVEKKLNTGDVRASDVIRTARKYMGVPHCMGGTTSKCMDCSGLLVRAFATHGINLPHNSEEQARYGRILTDKAGLKKGDLVFFIRTYRTSNYITHSGIYLGDNQFLHASSSRGVTITSLDNSWWKDKFIFGTRIF
jgi:cell wall-associated NlpC family hydrolase